jgi:hypothetical protein
MCCFSLFRNKFKKSVEITPNLRALLFLVETTGAIAIRVLIKVNLFSLFSGKAPAGLPSL